MKWTDERHPLFVGAVLGQAMRHGLDVRPEIDEDGDYTDRLVLDLGDDVRLTLVVPPPPEDWSLADWIPEGDT